MDRPRPKEAAKIRKILQNYGFSEAAITNCDSVFDYPADCISQALERDVNFSPETIAASSVEEQVKCLNLLAYFAEKDT